MDLVAAAGEHGGTLKDGAAGIVSWVTVNQYPKSAELLVYAAVMLAAPAAGWIACRAAARARGKARDDPSPAEDVEEPSVEALPRRGRVLSTASLVLGVCLCYLLTLDVRIHGMVDMFHEGERLAPLTAWMFGKAPYRDIFLQHGLGRNYLFPMWAALSFEPTVEGARRFFSIVGPLAYVAVFLLARLLYRTRTFGALLLAAVVSGGWFWVVPRQGLGIFSTFLLALWLSGTLGRSTGARRALFLPACAGAVAAAGLWYSLEFGLYTAAASGLFLLLYAFKGGGGFRPVFAYGGGWLAVSTLVAGWLFAQGALTAAIENFYIQCAYHLEVWGLPFPTWRSLLAELHAGGFGRLFLSDAFIQYLAPTVLALTGAVLGWRAAAKRLWQDPRSATLLLLFLQGALSFRTALGRSDLGHWVDGSTYFWILSIYFIDATAAQTIGLMSGERTPRQWKLPRIVAASVCSWWLIWLAHERHQPYAAARDRLSRLFGGPSYYATQESLEGLGKLAIPPGQVEQIKAVVLFIHQHTEEGEPIFDFSNQGAYYFFAKRPPATRFFQPIYAPTLALQRELVRELEAARVRLIIFKTGSVYDAIDGISNGARHPVVAEYLHRHFHRVTDQGGTEIWLRKVENG